MVTSITSDGCSRWSSEIELLWPYGISARGEGDVQKDAEHAAGMELFLKLKKVKKILKLEIAMTRQSGKH